MHHPYFLDDEEGEEKVHMGVLRCFSHVQLFATLWTVAHQAPLSMGFSREEYWSGLPFPSPVDLPDPVSELSCFFNDPVDVGNLISGSSALFKSSLNIWKFTVHILLKTGLENFEHYFASV